MSGEATSIGLKIPVKAIPVLLPLMAGGLLGFSGGGFADMTGAKAWKEANQANIDKVEDLEKELVELRAEKRQLLALLDGATLRIDP